MLRGHLSSSIAVVKGNIGVDTQFSCRNALPSFCNVSRYLHFGEWVDDDGFTRDYDVNDSAKTTRNAEHEHRSGGHANVDTTPASDIPCLTRPDSTTWILRRWTKHPGLLAGTYVERRKV